MVSKTMASFTVVSLFIIAALDNVNARSTTLHAPGQTTFGGGCWPTCPPTAPNCCWSTHTTDTTTSSSTTTSSGTTITGGTASGDSLESCYRRLKGQQVLHDHCNKAMAMDLLNVDDCYENLNMCDKWVNECNVGSVPTMPPQEFCAGNAVE